MKKNVKKSEWGLGFRIISKHGIRDRDLGLSLEISDLRFSEFFRDLQDIWLFLKNWVWDFISTTAQIAEFLGKWVWFCRRIELLRKNLLLNGKTIDKKAKLYLVSCHFASYKVNRLWRNWRARWRYEWPRAPCSPNSRRYFRSRGVFPPSREIPDIPKFCAPLPSSSSAALGRLKQ